MNPDFARSFAAAVILHGLVLFGFSMDTPFRSPGISEVSSPIDVSLIESAPEPAPAPDTPPALQEPPAPEATPEPQATQEPSPPEMPVTPLVPAPAPGLESMPEFTPVPERPKPMPRPDQHGHSRPSTPHSAPGSAAALAGAAGHRASGHGAAGGQLSSNAHYLSNPRPDYPEEARQQHQAGVVMLSVEVGADGRPTNVSVSRGSGFPLLDDAAVRAVRRWVFEPARAAGLPVASRVDVPVRFSLSQ